MKPLPISVLLAMTAACASPGLRAQQAAGEVAPVDPTALQAKAAELLATAPFTAANQALISDRDFIREATLLLLEIEEMKPDSVRAVVEVTSVGNAVSQLQLILNDLEVDANLKATPDSTRQMRVWYRKLVQVDLEDELNAFTTQTIRVSPTWYRFFWQPPGARTDSLVYDCVTGCEVLIPVDP